jgi:uncharacterized protein YwgA
MDRLRQYALVAGLAHRLRGKGSWCGETHLQKATYFLQKLQKVPVGFEFFLYKHGPFSFDLRDELTAMRSDGLLELRPQWPYGPSFVPTAKSRELRQHYSKTLKKYQKQLDFVSHSLGNRNVAELEKLATALYITLEESMKSETQRAKRLHSLKPHVAVDDALKAVKAVDVIIKASKQV